MPQPDADREKRREPGFKLSVVVPAYNEAAVLPEFHRRLSAVLDGVDARSEILYVNDGSTDQTLALLQSLHQRDPRVGVVDLSRNFGKEIALTAGLDHSSGDAVVVIDADLQDPPELIPELIRVWREGYEAVFATRTEREGESFLKRATARAFYRVIQSVGRVRIPENTGDFRLLSRRAVEALGQLREHHRFMKGLFAWIGFPQRAVFYRRDARAAGDTKWNYWKLWNFALDGITGFTNAPLKIASYLGFVIALASFVFGSWIVFKTLLFGDPVHGYPSLMVAVLFMGGVQLLFIGILGEYQGRTFDEAKRRPLYLINAFQPAEISRPRLGRDRAEAGEESAP